MGQRLSLGRSAPFARRERSLGLGFRASLPHKSFVFGGSIAKVNKCASTLAVHEGCDLIEIEKITALRNEGCEYISNPLASFAELHPKYKCINYTPDPLGP